MKALISIACLTLVACGGGTDVPNSHDSKYRTVEIDGDTCVVDSETSLVWQVKSSDSGLNDFRHTYSWFDPDEAVGELDYRGTENGGRCTGSVCDTYHYVQAVNAVGLCGHRDWRIPLRDELYSISDLRRVDDPPTINTKLFPNAQAAEYWSSNDYSFQYDTAWAWNFALGHDRVDWKKTPKFVRLVRGTATDLARVKE